MSSDWYDHQMRDVASTIAFVASSCGEIVMLRRLLRVLMTSLDEVFGLLDAERRRYALYHLEDRGEPVPVTELAECVAEWQSSGGAIPDEKFAQVHIELVHNDLPKAAELEYIRYDPEERVVELTSPPTAFETIVTVAKVIERPSWN